MEIDISLEVEGAAKEVARLYKNDTFRESLNYLNTECHIPIKQIAEVVGVHRQYLYDWANGRFVPRNPFPLVVIIKWATKQKEEKQHGPLAV